jgi:surface carbohydrate biosynthesis protein
MTGEPAVRWLHLPVETKARELEARILLACVASERGFGSVIGRKGEVAKMADRLPRGVYIEKSAQRVMQRGVETRNRLGHVECCLDEEGVVYINAADYTEGRLARPVLDRFHRFFAWGGDQAEVVSSYHPPLADRIRITGNPRVDFWRPELRSLHAGSTESLRDEIGPFVLFTTAFAMVNNSRGDEYFVDTLRSNGRLETAEGAKQVEGYIAHSRRIFDEMLTAVRKLGEARPDLRVVVRPHPSEDITTWDALQHGALIRSCARRMFEEGRLLRSRPSWRHDGERHSDFRSQPG